MNTKIILAAADVIDENCNIMLQAMSESRNIDYLRPAITMGLLNIQRYTKDIRKELN